MGNRTTTHQTACRPTAVAPDQMHSTQQRRQNCMVCSVSGPIFAPASGAATNQQHPTGPTPFQRYSLIKTQAILYCDPTNVKGESYISNFHLAFGTIRLGQDQHPFQWQPSQPRQETRQDANWHQHRTRHKTCQPRPTQDINTRQETRQDNQDTALTTTRHKQTQDSPTQQQGKSGQHLWEL